MTELKVGMRVRLNSLFKSTEDYQVSLLGMIGVVKECDEERIKLHFEGWKGGHGPTESYWWVYKDCVDPYFKEVEYPEDGSWV